MSTSLSDTETLSNKMIDLPCWLFDEDLTSVESKKSIVLSTRKRQENNVHIMQNSKIKKSVFQSNVIPTIIKIFICVCQFFGMTGTAICSE